MKKITFSKKQVIFIIRFVLFVAFAFGLPFGVLCWRFGLLKKITSTTIGVGGLVGILLIFFLGKYVYKSLKEGEPYSYAIQIVNGLLKVVAPCGLLALGAYELRDSINTFVEVMVVVCASECVAVFVNPMPKWIEEHRTEKATNLVDILINKRHEENKDTN